MKTSEMLLERLRSEGIVPESVTTVQVARTRSGCWQRAQGAWSWFALWERPDGGGHETAGSQWPMSDCVRAFRWETGTNEFGEISIDPRDENGRYL